MNNWVISIGIALLIMTFLTILLPKGKSGKFIKGISTIIVALVLLKPFSALKNGEIFSFSSVNEKIVIDENYLAYAVEKSIENKKNTIKKICADYEFLNSEVEIYYETNELYTTEIREVIIFVNYDEIKSTENEKTVIKKIKEYICVAFSVADKNIHINDKKI